MARSTFFARGCNPPKTKRARCFHLAHFTKEVNVIDEKMLGLLSCI